MIYEIIYWTYILSLGLLTLYCFFQLWIYLYSRNSEVKENLKITSSDLPYVTIQLPIYNERYVVERLINQVCGIKYPIELLEIQVVDDSDDNTVEIIERKVTEYRDKGFNIRHIRRENRSGYKAGALKHALNSAKGEYIAVFDADFLPRKNFLYSTLPYFQDKEVGVVQTRWSHLNSEYSILTEMQAFHLNLHFNVEQIGREKAGAFLQFNGTGGIWRKKCIEDAGGWSSDTLTEDLDLSYRAQLEGWKIKYLKNVDSPAELPVEMQGLKSQQFRWMKGGAETARKLIPTLLSGKISFFKKLHSIVHLFSSSVFLLLLIGLTSSAILLFVFDKSIEIGLAMYAFSLGFLLLGLVYYAANKNQIINNTLSYQGISTFLIKYPLFLSLSMGMALHNAIAVIEGYLNIKSPFIRTPKYAIVSNEKFTDKIYRIKTMPLSTYVEVFLAIIFWVAVFYAVINNILYFILFHLMAAIGFSVISFFSVKHSLDR